MSTTMQLQDLHDDYVWQVNAAVGEDRPDLVRQLSSAYLDQALELLSDGETGGCGRTDCPVCDRRPSPVGHPRRAWRRLAVGARRAFLRRRP